MLGESKLAKMACSVSLTPCFLNSDCVTAEIICITVLGHGLCVVCIWWVPPIKQRELLLPQGCVHWVSHKRRELWYGCCTSEERLCYGCSASPESINVSSVPPWGGVSFQPLSSHLPTLGSMSSVHSETQQDNWHHNQDDQWNIKQHRI